MYQRIILLRDLDPLSRHIFHAMLCIAINMPIPAAKGSRTQEGGRNNLLVTSCLANTKFEACLE